MRNAFEKAELLTKYRAANIGVTMAATNPFSDQTIAYPTLSGAGGDLRERGDWGHRSESYELYGEEMANSKDVYLFSETVDPYLNNIKSNIEKFFDTAPDRVKGLLSKVRISIANDVTGESPGWYNSYTPSRVYINRDTKQEEESIYPVIIHELGHLIHADYLLITHDESFYHFLDFFAEMWLEQKREKNYEIPDMTLSNNQIHTFHKKAYDIAAILGVSREYASMTFNEGFAEWFAGALSGSSYHTSIGSFFTGDRLEQIRSKWLEFMNWETLPIPTVNDDLHAYKDKIRRVIDSNEKIENEKQKILETNILLMEDKWKEGVITLFLLIGGVKTSLKMQTSCALCRKIFMNKDNTNTQSYKAMEELMGSTPLETDYRELYSEAYKKCCSYNCSTCNKTMLENMLEKVSYWLPNFRS
jgi:hypothetical protein